MEGTEKRKQDQSRDNTTEERQTPRGCKSNKAVASNVAFMNSRPKRRELCRRGNLTSAEIRNRRSHVLVCARSGGAAAARPYEQGVNDSNHLQHHSWLGNATVASTVHPEARLSQKHWLVSYCSKRDNTVVLECSSQMERLPASSGASVHLSSYQHSGQGGRGRVGSPERSL